jgi:hypothetical protein
MVQVYVAAAKRSIMSCLDLPPHLAALLTTNHLDANIHAVRHTQQCSSCVEMIYPGTVIQPSSC